MRKWKYVLFSALVFVFTLISIAHIQAQFFKSKEFLEYSESSRSNYIVIATGMAGLIAGQNRPEQSQCIDQWVRENRRQGYQSAISAMRKFPDHHPSAVLIAVLQKACGSFSYRSR
jgi:hypothetical protein